MLDRSDLRPYQEHAVEFIKATPYCALWVQMRLGKSIATLTALVELFEEYEIAKVLIVAPKRVAIDTWPQEFQQWRHIRDYRYSLINGNPKQRARAAASRAPFHIISRDNIRWLVEHMGTQWPYDVVVLDESRSFKNHKVRTPNKRYTRFGAVASIRKHLTRVIELTGTPCPKGAEDLWAQIYLLDQGKRLGKNITAFRQRWFELNYNGYGYRPRLHSTGQIEKQVEDIVFVLESGDYVSLPEEIPNPIEYHLPASVASKYKKLEKEFVLELGDNETLLTPSASSTMIKLNQLATGTVYTHDPGSGEAPRWEAVHHGAYDELDELLDELGGEPVLLAYVFRSDRERLLKKYPHAVALDADPDAIPKWNRGEIELMICHPASAGHGISLHGVTRDRPEGLGHNIVWFGCMYDLELVQQLNKRLSHPAKIKPIVIHRIMAKDTIHQDIVHAIDAKDATQAGIMRRLKERTNVLHAL